MPRLTDGSNYAITFTGDDFEITPEAITFIVMPGQGAAGSNYTTTFVKLISHSG